MARMPRERRLDSTWAVLRNPYGFISEECRLHRSDVFEARLMFQRSICMTGHDAAALLYDAHRFVRRGAAPEPLRKTLFGEGGVQGLDDESHRHRKAMFMSLMAPERLTRLSAIATDWWGVYADRWTAMNRVVLYDASHEILTRTICEWAGVAVSETELPARTQQLTALFDQAGAVGLGHLRSRLARKQADQWLEDVIRGIRAGRPEPPGPSAAHVIAWHRDLNGDLLDPHTAAVELNNVLRPTVAVSVFITFAALALHHYPECRQRLLADPEDYLELFVQEVRRFYPFFPMVTARVREDFEWQGYQFPRGRRVLLDLFGTNHDARVWKDPERFRPERFRDWDGSPFSFIPQGGGDHRTNHRCPGEWITIALMKVAVNALVTRLTYEVPAQDLTVDTRRLPALPRSRFIMANVRRVS